MARAKRTERAAARRRYRSAVELETGDLAAPSPSTERPAPSRPAAASPGVAADGPRLGIGAALRASVHPLRAREDLAALPVLVRHRSLWIPALVTVGGAILVAAAGLGNDSGLGVVGLLVFQYFLFPPALGGPFLVGFLATRASWLLGAIVGAVAAACYSVLILAFASRITTAAPEASQVQTAAISAFILSPVLGAFFASAAAWYRRFLVLTNPNRGRRPSQAPKRVGDGKTRAAPPKAGTKATVRR